MYITTEILRSKGACDSDIKYIERFYPNGAEMIDIIHDQHIPKEFLHWGREHLTNNTEELEAYCDSCNIINSSGYWYSQNVENSKYIVKSQEVSNSISVFDSIDVVNSVDIVNSENVLDSKQIFHSSMIDKSEKIFKGQNITDGINVCYSTMVANSKNIIESFNIFNSSEIINCVNTTKSYFCQNSRHIKHCMFCSNIKDIEYHVFNKPIEKELFELLEKQYLRYMTNLLDFIRQWPSELSKLEYVAPTRKFDDWFCSVSSSFWKWASTLPNFNSSILYNITMMPELIEK